MLVAVQAFQPTCLVPSRISARTSALPALRMTAAESKETLLFTQEMRNKAMSLHTFSQAPKEGTKKDTSTNTQVAEWQTTTDDFLQFLVDSQVVYEAFEQAVENGGLTTFKNTGLERVEGLKEDIKFIETKYQTKAKSPTSQAKDYASFIINTAKNNEPVFVCHFYNYYFAHTAGGRMIGQKVMDSSFDGHLFNFYKWNGDVKEILAEVKGRIDGLAEKWTREQKDASLEATKDTFSKSGALLRVLVGKAIDRAARMTSKVQVKGGKIVKVPTSPYSTTKAAWDV
eukprot:CAMPEP_0184298480 /NCGR_PEP_ID=MMETSP1049-20130417/9282_1 /TAXON_ID=77928 /ORGANISM="Proteomonas sulcata, Strain CCMP704" /LENGTH=284 /DNA_ID=CAMNT_0026608625 /DNA_START=1 /DNA_END=855 /DNA_ORIENTATION=+